MKDWRVVGVACGVFDDVFLLYYIYYICMDLVDFDRYCIHLCELKNVYHYSHIVRNMYVHVHALV